MTQKEQLRLMVKKMIAEAVSHRIAEIDKAGDVAANEAKMTRIKQETDKVKKVKELMEKVNLSYYLGEKLYSKVMEEMDKSINEYESAGLELEERMSGGKDADKKGKKKGAKSDKKDEKPEEKDEVLETEEPVITEGKITVVINYNTDEDDIRYISNILKNAGILAKVEAGIDSEEVEITIEKSDLKKATKALSADGFELQNQ